MAKKPTARPVIPGCDIEGEILEKARKRKKQTDPRYTQSYVAGLVGMDQNYWYQWQKGTTRILDEYWLRFAKELDFDPFESRPQLLRIKRQLDDALAASGSAVAEAAAEYETVRTEISELSQEGRRELISGLCERLNLDDLAWASALFSDRVVKLLESPDA